MIYNNFKGHSISALGLGGMRLPVVNEVYSDIDLAKTEEMIDYAFKNGINYFDTAYGYHDGQSEVVLGKLLKKYKRESFYLADKFPGYDPENMLKIKEIFEGQLNKCQVDYFDFYLLHNVCEDSVDRYLDPKYGLIDFLVEMKKQGKIKHIGFSSHGGLNTLRKLLEARGNDLEFCLIQLNYLDYEFQHAKEKVALLDSFNVPVWVMEPLRGGKLAQLTKEQEQELAKYRNEGVPAWAFRFLQTIPSIKVILSGMSNFEQLKENIETFKSFNPLSSEEKKVVMNIADEILKIKTLPCTRCRYCTAYCPQGLDIPTLIEIYNEHIFSNGGYLAPMLVGLMPEEKRPSACIGCKSCESICPQKIEISKMMIDLNEKIGG